MEVNLDLEIEIITPLGYGAQERNRSTHRASERVVFYAEYAIPDFSFVWKMLQINPNSAGDGSRGTVRVGNGNYSGSGGVTLRAMK